MKLLKFLIVLVIIFLVLGVGFLGLFYLNIQAPSSNEENIIFEVNEEDTFSTIGIKLESSGLIKSELFYKLYVKITSPEGLQVGPYSLSSNMSVEEIISVLSGGSTYNPNEITVTFREGLHMRNIASIIEEYTSNSYEDVMDLLNNDEYISSLIDKYWFLTEEIKSSEIYYPLEGYLFPSTYSFYSKDIDLEEIFEIMLNQTDVILTDLKQYIESSDYTVHEMITMASIIELEASSSSDRAGVAGVFYNRLEDNWSLGSDVTTYYAIKVDVYERDLFQSEIDDINAYNTRPSASAGKLPIGPICNPGLESIDSAINPLDHNNYYFVADINGVTHFTQTDAEHVAKVNELKANGLWYEYN